MANRKYKLVFIKKSAKISKESFQSFIIDILKSFGGLSLLSNIKIVSLEDSILEIEAEDSVIDQAHVSLMMCGHYKGIECCFREI